MDQKIPFLSVVESNVSGFKGKVTSRAQHVNGCDRYWVQPAVDKDGRTVPGEWFDEQELVVISNVPIFAEKELADGTPLKKPGGFSSSIK